jgi:hypothetical protein
VVASELKREGSGREVEALAAEIWEGVLRSVAKALQRKSDSGSTVRDFEPYLLAAFHHGFHRFQRADGSTLQHASASLNLGLVEGARDTEWVLELERAITVRQITDSRPQILLESASKRRKGVRVGLWFFELTMWTRKQ